MAAGVTTYLSYDEKIYLGTLKDIFMNEAKTINNYIPMLYEVVNTKKIANSYKSFAGLGNLETWDGESAVSYVGLDERYETTITQAFWRKGVSFSWKNRKYEQYDLMKQAVQSLAVAAARTKQTYAINWIYNSLLGSDTTYYWNATAAKYLFSDTHALQSGGTYDNLISGALSVTTLDSAITALYMTPDDQGHPMGIMPKRLWVRPDNYGNAIEVVNKGVGLKSGTGDNTKNSFDITAKGLEIVPCEFLGTTSDTDCWILQGDYNKLICEVSVDLEFGDWAEESDKSLCNDALFAFQVGARDWRGWVGSRGA